MGPLPDTVEGIEVVWTLLALIAATSSVMVWRWARGDLAYVRASGRPHLARSFLEDVRNARWRLALSTGLVVAGILAMTQEPMAAHRSRAGWVILVLIFGSPLQVILRNLSEAKTRRAIRRDVARENRTGQPPGGTP